VTSACFVSAARVLRVVRLVGTITNNYNSLSAQRSSGRRTLGSFALVISHYRRILAVWKRDSSGELRGNFGTPERCPSSASTLTSRELFVGSGISGTRGKNSPVNERSHSPTVSFREQTAARRDTYERQKRDEYRQFFEVGSHRAELVARMIKFIRRANSPCM